MLSASVVAGRLTERSDGATGGVGAVRVEAIVGFAGSCDL